MRSEFRWSCSTARRSCSRYSRTACFQAGIDKVVQAVGLHRQIAARQLVLTLCASLDALQPACDGKVDRLIIAGFEMQERQMFGRAPVAAIKLPCRPSG